MNTITKVRIARCSEIMGDRISAIIHLDNYNHVFGQPVMVRYYKEDGNIDTITAIGVKTGQGQDCYSIISTGERKIVADVLDVLPDVTTLIYNIPYISKVDDVWYLVSIDETGTTRTLNEMTDGEIFYSLSDGHEYYSGMGGKVWRDDRVLDLTNDKFDLLSHGRLSLEFSIPEILVRDGEILENPRFNITVKTEDGIDVTTSCSVSATTGGIGVDCSRAGRLLIISDNVAESKEYSITVKYEIGEESTETTKTIKAWVVAPTYYGVLGGQELQEVLWSGQEDLNLVFNLNKSKSVLKVPASMPRIKHIFDIHGLDYINDYNIRAEGSWTIYEKIDAVSINNFRQIFRLSD